MSPDGGRFYEPTLVALTAEDGCSIYYTWDGTDPTTASARYTEPFEVPEGNNVLSVLVVDKKTGLTAVFTVPILSITRKKELPQ